MEAGSFEVVELSDSEDERNGVVNSRQVNGSSSCGSEKVPGSTAVPDKVGESAEYLRLQKLGKIGSIRRLNVEKFPAGVALRGRLVKVEDCCVSVLVQSSLV